MVRGLRSDEQAGPSGSCGAAVSEVTLSASIAPPKTPITPNTAQKRTLEQAFRFSSPVSLIFVYNRYTMHLEMTSDTVFKEGRMKRTVVLACLLSLATPAAMALDAYPKTTINELYTTTT
jgi:hypothetical protein